jgi:hypothetical protein
MRQNSISIPANLEGDDCTIIAFILPNREFVLPVRSALYTLTTGRAWDRDNREGSIKAAQQWGEFIMSSMGVCSFGDIISLLQSINDKLPTAGTNEENEVTTIINNVGCGCGCGCGQDADEPIVPTPEPYPPTPPAGVPNGAATRCAWANYLVYQHRLAWLTMADTTSYADALDKWKAIFLAAYGNPFALTYQGYLYLKQIMQRPLSEIYDEAHSEFVCAIYSQQSPEDALSAFSQALEIGLAAAGSGNVRAALYIASYLPFDTMFSDNQLPPSSWYGRACCGEIVTEDTPPLPAAPDGYEWVDGDAITISYSAFTTAFSPAVSSFVAEAAFTSTNQTWQATASASRPAGRNVKGWAYHVVENVGTAGNDPGTSYVRVNGIDEGIFSRFAGVAAVQSIAGDFDGAVVISDSTALTGRLDVTAYRRVGVSGNPAGEMRIAVANMKYLVVAD